jgi:enoyl-CoA hydratase
MHLRQTLEAAGDWASTPDASGRRPIDDPSVRRRLGDAALDLEVGLNAADDMARAFCSEALIERASDLLDLSGQAGLLREGAPGAVADGLLELRHRSAQATAIYGGSTDIHRNIVAERVLGLPRHRSAHTAVKPAKNPTFRGVPMQVTSSNPNSRTEEGSGIIRVTFTRDDKRNAVSPDMFDAIDAALTALENRDDLRVMVIRAEGRFFTAGVDISGMKANLGEGTDGVIRGSNMRSQYRNQARHDLFDRMEAVEKPVVLAVQGPCLGVGIEFGSSCDFRLASDAATFSLPEIPNLAVIPGSGGISRLTRLIGPHWAKWMVMSGRTITAQQALNIGFVHEVHPAAELDAAVDAFTTTLVGMPREALGLAKITVDTAAEVDRRTARQIDRLAQTLLFTSSEYRDRVDRFLNKK